LWFNNIEDGGWWPSWIYKNARNFTFVARGCAEMIIMSHLMTAQMAATMRATAVA